MSEGFVVPFALDESGDLVPPAQAVRGRAYRCPDCEAPLTFRDGEIVSRHFAHRPDVDVDRPCSSESVQHKIAKRRIVEAVEAWLRGSAPAPVVVHRCKVCGEETVRRPLPGWIVGAQEECVVGAYRLDVALLDSEGPRLAVEILHSHAVDEGKAAELAECGFRWCELKATDVLADPLAWEPKRGSSATSGTCKACEAREASARGAARLENAARAKDPGAWLGGEAEMGRRMLARMKVRAEQTQQLVDAIAARGGQGNEALATARRRRDAAAGVLARATAEAAAEASAWEKVLEARAGLLAERRAEDVRRHAGWIWRDW